MLSAGLSIAGELEKEGLPLIADFKVADIPNTDTLICDQVFAAGFSGIICHGFTGMDSMKACVASAHAHKGECFVVAEMSHPGGKEFFSGGSRSRSPETRSSQVPTGSSRRPPADRVRVLRGFIGDKKILSPGIGTQGGDADAIATLVDGIIVGRSIYDAPDPAAAAQSYAHLRRDRKA